MRARSWRLLIATFYVTRRFEKKQETVAEADALTREELTALEGCFPGAVLKLFPLTQHATVIGGTCFTNKYVTKNYSVEGHKDKAEEQGFIIHYHYGELAALSLPADHEWAITCLSGLTGSDTVVGGEFVFPEWGYYFKPAHGTVTELEAAKVFHFSREVTRGVQLGTALVVKTRVLKESEKEHLLFDEFLKDRNITKIAANKAKRRRRFRVV